MKKFALLNENNVVVNISIADNSWNSIGWLEYADSNPASISGDYVDGYFYPMRPFASWTRVEGTWQPPTTMPTEGRWYWDEETTSWIEQALP